MGTFLKKAEELGIDIKKFKGVKSYDETIFVDSIDKLKSLLTEGLPTARKASNNAPSTLAEKVHDHIFFNTSLNEKDKKLLKHISTIPLRVVSGSEKILAPGEVWDLGSQTTYIEYDKLTMGAGSSIKISGAVLTMKIGTLVRNVGGTKGANYDLGIFGITGAPCVQAQPGTDGGNGEGGKAGTCCSGGGIAGDNGKPGADGGNAGKGSEGLSGNNGFPSLTANITISKNIEGNAGQFIIYSTSGDGGQGGKGGNGGKGGAGGKGGDGATCACEHTDGGNGGKGGNGGDGGDGGQGGDATKGNDIFVVVPAGQSKRIIKLSEIANPGSGGVGGNGGAHGAGGSGGSAGGASGCPSGNNGTNGNAGNAGNSGVSGKGGTQTGAPGIIYVSESK